MVPPRQGHRRAKEMISPQGVFLGNNFASERLAVTEDTLPKPRLFALLKVSFVPLHACGASCNVGHARGKSYPGGREPTEVVSKDALRECIISSLLRPESFAAVERICFCRRETTSDGLVEIPERNTPRRSERYDDGLRPVGVGYARAEAEQCNIIRRMKVAFEGPLDFGALGTVLPIATLWVLRLLTWI